MNPESFDWDSICFKELGDFCEFWLPLLFMDLFPRFCELALYRYSKGEVL